MRLDKAKTILERARYVVEGVVLYRDGGEVRALHSPQYILTGDEEAMKVVSGREIAQRGLNIADLLLHEYIRPVTDQHLVREALDAILAERERRRAKGGKPAS